jgi:hypothetical protein
VAAVADPAVAEPIEIVVFDHALTPMGKPDAPAIAPMSVLYTFARDDPDDAVILVLMSLLWFVRTVFVLAFCADRALLVLAFCVDSAVLVLVCAVVNAVAQTNDRRARAARFDSY